MMTFPRHAIPTPGQYAGFCLMVVLAGIFWPVRAKADTDLDLAIAAKNTCYDRYNSANTQDGQVYNLLEQICSWDADVTDRYNSKKAVMTQADKTAVEGYLTNADSKLGTATDYYNGGHYYIVGTNQGNYYKSQGDGYFGMHYYTLATGSYNNGTSKYNSAKTAFDSSVSSMSDANQSLNAATAILDNYP